MHRFPLLVALVSLVLTTYSSPVRGEEPTEELPPPWELTRVEDGEAKWAPLFRLREMESAYRDTHWWNGYAQMRAHVEVGIGNHAAALAAWDWGFPGQPEDFELPADISSVDALEYVNAAADTAHVIMINERHHAASDRLLTLELLPLLWEKGFRYFAAEAFWHEDTDLNSRGYPVESTGGYVKEPVFAAAVREALSLGYTLVPYESTADHVEGDELSSQQRRDFEQAKNLAAATVDLDPEAKVLVHAGYSHILEEVNGDWHPMALYFRERTGIDPLTVDQTRLSERSDPAYEHGAYRTAIHSGLLATHPVILVDAGGQPYAAADLAVDLQVLTPRTEYREGRPTWMEMGGRRVPLELEIPEARQQWCYVEVRRAGEPDEAVALDRVEVENTDRAWIHVPMQETFVLRVFGSDGTLLRENSTDPVIEGP